jgi:hypothetical protein
MAEIRNSAVNSGCRGPAGLTFAVLTSADAEIRGDSACHRETKEI